MKKVYQTNSQVHLKIQASVLMQKWAYFLGTTFIHILLRTRRRLLIHA